MLNARTYLKGLQPPAGCGAVAPVEGLAGFWCMKSVIFTLRKAAHPMDEAFLDVEIADFIHHSQRDIPQEQRHSIQQAADNLLNTLEPSALSGCYPAVPVLAHRGSACFRLHKTNPRNRKTGESKTVPGMNYCRCDSVKSPRVYHSGVGAECDRSVRGHASSCRCPRICTIAHSPR